MTKEKTKIRLQPFTMHFVDEQDIEQQYWDNYLHIEIKNVIYNLYVWLICFSLFVIFDYIVNPSILLLSVILRICIFVPVSLFLIHIIQKRKYNQFVQLIFATFYLLSVFIFNFLIFNVSSSYRDLFYFISLIQFIFGAMAIKMRFEIHVYTSVVLLVFLQFFFLSYNLGMNTIVIYNLLMISTVGIGLLMNYYTERHDRYMFYMSYQLKMKQLEMEIFNQNLRNEVEHRTRDLLHSNSILKKEIDKRNNMERRITEQKLMLDDLFNGVEEGIGIVDKNEVIIFANPAFKRIFDDPHIIGKNLLAFFDAENQDFIKRETQKRKRHETSTYELSFYTKSGKLKHIRSTVSPRIGKTGEYLGAFGALLDITELKNYQTELIEYKQHLEEKVSQRTNELAEANRLLQQEINDRTQAEEEVKLRNRELKKAYAQIKKATQMKEMFIANMSHEIRTPLHAINGYINLMLNSQLPLKEMNYLNNIKISTDHLLLIINDILDFSKIEAGKLVLNEDNFDFYQILGDFLSSIRIKATEKNITLDCHFDPKISNFLIGDYLRLTQILTNLIGNAIKFTESGGSIYLNAQAGSETETSITVVFQVVDSGIGIPEDKLNIIFDNFSQVSPSMTRKYGGTGLGLAIVKRLISLMNGTIDVKSVVGEGTEFSFAIPFKKGSKDKSSSKQIIKLDDYSVLSGIKVLLVEDNPINQEIAVDTLQMLKVDITVDLAENGLVAIKKILTNDYHVVLMDIQMPEMNGYDAIKYIRNKIPSPKNQVPVVGMTAHAMETEREKCISLGMNEYLVKPFIPDELFYRIALAAGSLRQVNSSASEISEQLTEIKRYTYIDLLKLPKIYQVNTAKTIKILTMCLTNIPVSILNLNQQIEEQNWNSVRDTAHSLKTLMLYMGLKRNHSLLEIIEKSAMLEDNLDKIADHLIQVEALWEYAKVEIQEEIHRLKIMEDEASSEELRVKS